MTRQVACIGMGNVGRSWAIVFARAGFDVAVWDKSRENAERSLRLVSDTLKVLEPSAEAAQAVMGRITLKADIASAVEGASWVQESAAEAEDIKRALFADLDRDAEPGAILASSTSAIPGSHFMLGLPGAARCLIAHPVNPPHLVPLVELCGTPETSAATLQKAYDFMAGIGQSPVVLNREIEGFVLNRLQWALMSEALHLVGEGYCSAADIDLVMTSGLARRWALYGPLAVAHLNASAGFEGYFDVLSEAFLRVQKSLRTDYPVTQDLVASIQRELVRKMPQEEIPDLQKSRDKLVQALGHFLGGLPG